MFSTASQGKSVWVLFALEILKVWDEKLSQNGKPYRACVLKGDDGGPIKTLVFGDERRHLVVGKTLRTRHMVAEASATMKVDVVTYSDGATNEVRTVFAYHCEVC
jgi:hypothetical protein